MRLMPVTNARGAGRSETRVSDADSSSSLFVGRCYATAANEVRKIVEFDGSYVVYVVGRGGGFPSWDKRRWCSLMREAFAREITSEVPCDWHPRTR
jgi:hypothetical protein